MSDDFSNGSMKVFHPRGPQVWLPVPFDGDYRKAFAAVGAALDAGFLAVAPGLEPGEEKEQVGWLVRGSVEQDGETTPYLLLYSADDNMSYSFLKVYLNKPEDVAAFEFASGMKLDRIPEYEGNDKPERGTSAKLEKYFARPSRPFTVVYKHNPKYDESAKAAAVAKKEIYKVPVRLFVRWADMKPAIEPDSGDAGIRANLDRYIAEKGLPAAADLVLKGLAKHGVKESDALRKFGLTDRKTLAVEHVVTMRGDLNAISKGGARAGELYPPETGSKARTDRSKRFSGNGAAHA
jgi:hypothetical protein